MTPSQKLTAYRSEIAQAILDYIAELFRTSPTITWTALRSAAEEIKQSYRIFDTPEQLAAAVTAKAHKTTENIDGK